MGKRRKNTAREAKKKRKIKRKHLYREPDLPKREFDNLSESIQKSFGNYAVNPIQVDQTQARTR